MNTGSTDMESTDTDATRTGIYAHQAFSSGAVLGGRYRIDALLGVGGMGMVYRAEDLVLGVPVALKLLRPELAQRSDAFARFRQELLLARQVSSPHVVRIHDLAQIDGHWLISMDFVDGETLERRIDRDGPLPVDDAIAIATAIAEGLAAAHARGVVHRDLKPANILIDREGRAYIGDFGVARSLAAAGPTRAGAVVGTPDYLSPEQARGEAADARSDLYALGLMLHEMLTGTQPFPGGTLPEVLAQRMLRAPEPVHARRPDTPAWLAGLLARLLRAQPAHRLQTADEAVAILAARALPREPLRLRLARAGGTRGGRAALAAAAVLLTAMAVGLWWMSRAPTPAPGSTVAGTPAGTPAAAGPPDRLLVAPLQAEPAVAARDAALGAHLRWALAGASRLPVVDAERTALAARRADPSGQARRLDPAALRRYGGARRVLSPRLVRQAAGWRVTATLDVSGRDRSWEGPAAATPDAALRAWLAAPETASALGLAAPPVPPGEPATGEAQIALGEGLLARAEGRLAPALEALRRATTAAPGDAVAWEAQSRLALDMGERAAAADALVQAQRAAEDAPQAVRARLAAQRSAAEGDADAAVRAWTAIVDAAPGDTEAGLQRVRGLIAAGALEEAGMRLAALTARDPEDPRLWFERGKLAILQGEARLAVDDYLVRALVGFKRGDDAYGEAETVNALGIGYGRLGRTTDAVEQYRRAIALRRALGHRRGLATSLRNLANVLGLTGDVDGAAVALGEARALNMALGDRAAHAAVDNELGLLAEERGDFPGALEAYRRALRIWQEDGDTHGAAEALNNIGYASYQLGGYADAQVYWQQAADAYAALGEGTGTVRTLQNLGLLATARGRWREAHTLLQRALDRAESEQMVEEAAVSRRNLAELALLQGRLDQAQRLAGQAERAFAGREDVRGQVDAALLRARAALAGDDLATAAEASAALAPRLDEASREQRAMAALLEAELAERQGRASAEALARARALAAEAGVRHLQLRIALFAAGDDVRALARLDAPIAELGHVGLRLDWLRRRIAADLASGRDAAALAAYTEAAALLRGGEALQAEALHRLGAQARTRAGDAAGARAAIARAEEAAQARARPQTDAAPSAGGAG